MPKFFICYRREESQYPAQMIYQKLISEYDADSVVFDVDSVPLGADFREYLDNQVSRCDVLLAVIGTRWLDILNRRLDDDDDFVRIEIESALDRNIPIVPVLLAGVSIPASDSLPPSLEKLAYKNAAQVSAGKDLTTHLDRLLAGLEPLVTERKDIKVALEAEPETKRQAAAGQKSLADAGRWAMAALDGPYSQLSNDALILLREAAEDRQGT